MARVQQEQPQEQPRPRSQMFSGVVTSVDETTLAVQREGQGAAGPRKFQVTSETTFEGGKPGVNTRVTVRYVSTEEGDQAIHVIVRGAARR
jgi:hypothetical protein